MKKHFSLFNFRRKTLGFLRDDEGASAIEYAIIAGLIAVAFIAGASLLGKNIQDLFNDIGTRVGEVAVPETEGGD